MFPLLDKRKKNIAVKSLIVTRTKKKKQLRCYYSCLKKIIIAQGLPLTENYIFHNCLSIYIIFIINVVHHK